MSKRVVSIMLCMIVFISLFSFSSFATTVKDGDILYYISSADGRIVNAPVYYNYNARGDSPFYGEANIVSHAYQYHIDSSLIFSSLFQVPFYLNDGLFGFFQGTNYFSPSNVAGEYGHLGSDGNFYTYTQSIGAFSDTIYCVFSTRDTSINGDFGVSTFSYNQDSVDSAPYWNTAYSFREHVSSFFPIDKRSTSPVPEKPKYSTAKFDLVNTAPAVNLVVTNSGNIPSNVSVTDLFVGIKLNNPTTLEQYLWKKDLDCLGSCLVSVGSSGVPTTSTLFSYDFLPHGISYFKFKSGRSYTLTLYDFTGNDYFAADPDKMNILDTLTFTVDGTVKPPPDIPVGDTTYSPTPPQTPSTGDVNVITNTSGNITGIQQWDGNQWIIIDKIEIVNNPDSGGGSGGGTTPDKPTDDKGIWDWLFGKIGDLISTIFKGILDILTKCVSTLVDGVIAIIENLFKLLNSVVNFGGDFPKMLQGFFFFLPPEIITLICLMFTLSIAIIIIKFFIR